MNPLECLSALFAGVPPPQLADCANRAQIFQAVWLPFAVIVGALGTVVIALVPRLRRRARRVWASLRSLLRRFPFRLVRASTLSALTSEVERLRSAPAPAPAERSAPRPLSLQERVERAVAFCEEELGKYDATSPQSRPIGYFRTAAHTINEIVDELRGHVGIDHVLEQGVSRGFNDPTRAEIERAVRSLRAINWNKPAPGRATVVRR